MRNHKNDALPNKTLDLHKEGGLPEQTNKQIFNAIIGLLNELLTLGRHQRFSIIICSHLTSNYKATRLIMIEATMFIMYPKSSSENSLKHFLRIF